MIPKTLNLKPYKSLTQIFMSRIGKQPIAIPTGVTVEINDIVTIKGTKGTLTFNILPGVHVAQEEGRLIVSIENSEDKQQRAFWGLTRAMLQNMVVGVSE